MDLLRHHKGLEFAGSNLGRNLLPFSSLLLFPANIIHKGLVNYQNSEISPFNLLLSRKKSINFSIPAMVIVQIYMTSNWYYSEL